MSILNLAKMEHYITQLLEDMLAAHKLQSEEDKQVLDEDDKDIEAHFARIERYLSGDGWQEISSIIGFYPEQFPPVERLNESQMERVIVGFRELMRTHDVTFYTPEKLPTALEYHILTGALTREVYVPLNGGGDGGTDALEFCRCNVETCPFGYDFCECKDYNFDDDDDDDMENFVVNEGDLPF
jgi:hypothetical protein